MSEFGWTRLAYLSAILAVLAVLVKLGTFGVASISENFPESALTFAQRAPISEEHLDWEKRAADDPETTRAEDGHSASGDVEGEDVEDGHSDTEHSESEHSDTEHSEGGHVEDGDLGHSHEPVESIYENVNFAEDPPVFYRPAPQVSSAFEEPSSNAESCQTVGDAPPGSEILFPMTSEHFDTYDDTWGAARPQGGHEGTDLMVPNGTPLLAMTDGRIVPVAGANGNGWNTLGGYTVMLEAAYSVGPVKEGDLFYYAHMDRRGEFQIGDTVEAGDVVGFAGDTGQGPEGARGQFPPHLHLGWYETSGERTQLASGAMNPYPLLEWVKANGGSIAGGSDIPYCEAPQPSAPTPSGGGYWQFPSDPGVRPDMATGTGTAVPSPIVEQNDSAESSPDITREPREPVRPPRPANPANPAPAEPPPAETVEPTIPEPPNGAPNRPPTLPSIPNPLPGIGDLIGGILNPTPSEPPDENETTETATPAAPPENPGEPEEPPTESTPPEEPPDDGIPDPTTPPEDAPVEGTVPEDEATGDEEGDECEPHEHGDEERSDEEEAGGEAHEHADEDCSEETDSEKDEDPAPEDEATEQTPPDNVVEDQYEGGQSGSDGEGSGEAPSPEATSGP